MPCVPPTQLPTDLPILRIGRQGGRLECTRDLTVCESLQSRWHSTHGHCRLHLLQSKISPRARPSKAATISPDGHYLAVINTHDGRGAALVIDRSQAHQPPRMVLTEPPHFLLNWCRWATDTRLLCGYRGMVKPNGHVVCHNATGGGRCGWQNTKVLIQNSENAQGQFQDRVINWNPGPADTVLIEADEGLNDVQATGTPRLWQRGLRMRPAVFELNVVTGI
jgi:hypothetical protein